MTFTLALLIEEAICQDGSLDSDRLDMMMEDSFPGSRRPKATELKALATELVEKLNSQDSFELTAPSWQPYNTSKEFATEQEADYNVLIFVEPVNGDPDFLRLKVRRGGHFWTPDTFLLTTLANSDLSVVTVDDTVSYIADTIAADAATSPISAVEAEQHAEAQHYAYELLVAKYDLQQMFLERYIQLAVDQRTATHLAKMEIGHLNLTIQVLQDSMTALVAARSTANQVVIAERETNLARSSAFAAGAILAAGAALVGDVLFDRLDTSDEETAAASERSADALERSADVDEEMLEAFKAPIVFGGKCYKSTYGFAPPSLIPAPHEPLEYS